jgi:hypothetical protein
MPAIVPAWLLAPVLALRVLGAAVVRARAAPRVARQAALSERERQAALQRVRGWLQEAAPAETAAVTPGSER